VGRFRVGTSTTQRYTKDLGAVGSGYNSKSAGEAGIGQPMWYREYKIRLVMTWTICGWRVKERCEPSLTKFTPALARIAGCVPVSYQDEHVWGGH
jgi:hypothetical protein